MALLRCVAFVLLALLLLDSLTPAVEAGRCPKQIEDKLKEVGKSDEFKKAVGDKCAVSKNGGCYEACMCVTRRLSLKALTEAAENAGALDKDLPLTKQAWFEDCALAMILYMTGPATPKAVRDAVENCPPPSNAKCDAVLGKK